VALRPNSALARNNLGRALAELGRLPEAEAAYRRAIDLDPTYVYAHHGLGYALSEQGRWKEGEAAYRRAIDRDATFAYPHNGLGLCLFHQGRLEEAKTEFHQAIALDPKAVHPHYNLGGILMGEGRIEEAQAAFRQAIDLDPKYSAPYIGLGDALFRQGRLVEAQEQFRKAIELDPKSALSHINLGLVLANQGRLEEAKEAYQQAVTLGQKEAVELLRQCERRLVLIQRLPAVLKSEDRPTDPEEQLEFAAMCQATNQRRYAASARFYAEAFAQDAKLAANTERHYLYDAACAAALAGCGQGEDAGKLDETERARLRRQAREWLRDHLAYWSKQADSENPKARARVSQALKHWQADTDLAGLRDPEALAKLPDAERDACNQLWADVAALLKQASGGQ
jgi:Flp pilus assembly protein TadD